MNVGAIEGALLRNSSRVYLERFNRQFAAEMRPGALMLDVGAGSGPYRHLFSHVRYESADFEQVDKTYGQTTYVCDICEHIPVADDYFDYVLFNQTLEHLRTPMRALGELHRVLAPGGRMLCTVPLFYEEHEQPHDFYRYTQFAHRHMFGDTGFAIERLEWLEGFFGTCGYMLETIYRYAPSSVPDTVSEKVWADLFLAGVKPMALAAAGGFYRLDLLWKVTDIGFPKNYAIWAQKPDRDSPRT